MDSLPGLIAFVLAGGACTFDRSKGGSAVLVIGKPVLTMLWQAGRVLQPVHRGGGPSAGWSASCETEWPRYSPRRLPMAALP